jgi:hypothetical protein
MTDATELLRQVHPSWIQDSRPTSQAFRPTPKDAGLLSTDDGDQIAPQPSFLHYTTIRQLESVGVLGVTVLEFKTEELVVTSDATEHAPHHVSVDYNNHGRKAIEAKSKRLRNIACERGWRYLHSESVAADANAPAEGLILPDHFSQ